MLSSFTMISVIGVMLGVLVLVVVTAVIAGIEQQVKERILGFTPHILVQNPSVGINSEGGPSWQSVAERAMDLPEVEGATPHISDYVIFDVGSFQQPARFYAIDTSDPSQVEGIAAMLDHRNYPGSSADLGIDDRAVISSTIAEHYGVGVGSMIRLYSTRNFEEVMQVYRATDEPPVREAFVDRWEMATAVIGNWQEQRGPRPALPTGELTKALESLYFIYGSNIREPERELVELLIVALESGEREERRAVHLYDAETREEIEGLIEEINTTDVEEMDAEVLKGLKSFVLPKELEVVGVYQSSQMAMTPDIFVPIPIGQDLAGLESGVQGVSLRLKDAYRAEEVAIHARRAFGPGWAMVTWGQEYEGFFMLMGQQRVMMYFALSFIVLVSAFSMMAVMFTVTVQKKREIGVMKALGAAPGQIVRVFLYQGMLLGAVGAIIGIALGHVVIHFRGGVQSFMRTLGFDPFSESLIGSTIIPAHHNLVEQVLIGVCAFLLCSLAALVPAFFAARSDAAKSLRNL